MHTESSNPMSQPKHKEGKKGIRMKQASRKQNRVGEAIDKEEGKMQEGMLHVWRFKLLCA